MVIVCLHQWPFQLHQLMTNTHGNERLLSTVRQHLHTIELTSQESILGIANTLRRLVVDEWTGLHNREYRDFFIDCDIEREA